jgi:hypothetical protein
MLDCGRAANPGIAKNIRQCAPRSDQAISNCQIFGMKIAAPRFQVIGIAMTLVFGFYGGSLKPPCARLDPLRRDGMVRDQQGDGPRFQARYA